jgi:hypothetical protein
MGRGGCKLGWNGRIYGMGFRLGGDDLLCTIIHACFWREGAGLNFKNRDAVMGMGFRFYSPHDGEMQIVLTLLVCKLYYIFEVWQ